LRLQIAGPFLPTDAFRAGFAAGTVRGVGPARGGRIKTAFTSRKTLRSFVDGTVKTTPCPATLEDVGQQAEVEGIVADQVVRIDRPRIMRGEKVLHVTYTDAAGHLGEDFLTRACEKDLVLRRPGHPHRGQYPAGVSRLFESMEELVPMLHRLRRLNRLHPVVEAYIAEVATRASTPLETISEIYAVTGARNDALSVARDRSILWEVFGTASSIEGDLRKLERSTASNILKVAVVLDPEVDSDLFERFVRASQGSTVTTVFRVGDLMLRERFANTVRSLDTALLRMPAQGLLDELEIVAVGLYGTHRQWKASEGIPYGFALTGGGFAPLEDPAFFLDVQNVGAREARISAVFRNVVVRQLVMHGIPGDEVLRPSADFELPLNSGDPVYLEKELEDPILVPPGQHRRFVIRMQNAGYSWCGEIQLGLVYGPSQRRQIVAVSLSLFL
jgi:hypothetical protein